MVFRILTYKLLIANIFEGYNNPGKNWNLEISAT